MAIPGEGKAGKSALSWDNLMRPLSSLPQWFGFGAKREALVIELSMIFFAAILNSVFSETMYGPEKKITSFFVIFPLCHWTASFSFSTIQMSIFEK